MVNTFCKDYPEKPVAISAPLDFAPAMVKPIVNLFIKQKRGCPAKNVIKCDKE